MVCFKTSLAVVSLWIATVCCGIVSYPRPSVYTKSEEFALKVAGTEMYTVNFYEGYDYVQLSMDEGQPIEYRLRLLNRKSITSFFISPQKLPIDAKIVGNELVWTMKQAHYLIVKIDDLKEFVILADPTEKDVPSATGANVYNVLNYGADKTGGSVTTGIQKAMDAAAAHPGSIVYVPPGLYTIGNLLLRDQTSLYLAGGSVLRMTGNPSDYTTLYKKPDLLPGTWWIQTEFNSKDIKVYGRGVIDGNGKKMRDNKFMADLLVPVGTKNFKCDGILVRDSSFWAVTPTQVEDAAFTNLKILNRRDITQDDGIDVVESRRVTVKRAIAIARDDSFSTKTWMFNEGTTVPYPYQPQPLADVTFDDCLAWTDCYAYKVGQGVWENQDRVTFQNSVVYNAAVALGIDHKYGSKTANDITFKNIDIEKLHGNAHGEASWLTLWVEDTGKGVGPVKNVKIENVRARMRGAKKGRIEGHDNASKISGVTFTNVYIWENTKPGTTLGDLWMEQPKFADNVKIANK